MSSDATTAAGEFDPHYETTRVTDTAAFLRKLRAKRKLFRWVGEIYVGKRVKLAYFQDWLKGIPLPANPRVLEVGSGDGLFSFVTAATKPDARVVGLELNRTEAEACQTMAQEERLANLHFEPGLLSDHIWRGTFDFVFCLDVLEHIRDDVAALREMFSAMKPGAVLLIHVPNRHYLDVDNVLRTVPDQDAWRINPGHVRNGYAPQELKATLERAGFEIREVCETQGRPIAKAFRLYGRIERFLVARILILPLIDRLIQKDRKREWTHGNTVWTYARKPMSA